MNSSNSNGSKNKDSNAETAADSNGVDLMFSAALSNEPMSIKALMGYKLRGVTLDNSPETAEREMSRFESRYSELLMAANALPLKTSQSLYPVTIKNVVATVDTKCTLDLKKFCAATSCLTKIKKSILYMTTRFPCARLVLFGSGKILCSGTHSIEDSKTAIKKVVRMMRRTGLKAKFSKYEVVTTVSHVDAKFVIDIQSFYDTYTEYCTVKQ